MNCKLERLVRRFLCFVQGHPCKATGRRGYALREWRCQRCGGVYISHSDYGRALLPATPDSDEMLVRHMEAIRADACTPNNIIRIKEKENENGLIANRFTIDEVEAWLEDVGINETDEVWLSAWLYLRKKLKNPIGGLAAHARKKENEG